MISFANSGYSWTMVSQFLEAVAWTASLRLLENSKSTSLVIITVLYQLMLISNDLLMWTSIDEKLQLLQTF
jgi:hypothetical protein